MKLKKIAALIAIVGLSGSAFATNGDNLIGLGAQSRALGGTGTAAFYGAESALANPALLGKSKGTEFSIAGTLFMPSVTASGNPKGVAAGNTTKDSDSDLFGIPAVSLTSRVSNDLTFGFGMYGTSGMGVDYRDNSVLYNSYSSLQLMKFVPSVAYNRGNFGVGAAVAVQYGALDINYNNGTSNIGNGTSTDFGWGYNLGAYYDVSKDLTLGMSYQSEIKMTYKDQLTVAANGLGVGPTAGGPINSDKLYQPAELKLGVAYNMNNWLLTADYKRVYWGHAEGYKTFNWKDQDVFGLGVKYSANGWWIGGGYNSGEDPIEALPSTSGNNDKINMFNNLFFPAIVESHYTFGGGYQVGKNSSLDMALVYSPKVSKTVSTANFAGAGTSQTTEHSQMGVTVAVRMNF